MITLPTNTIHSTPVDDTPVRRELLTQVEADNYLMILDNSSLERLTTCPRSAEYYLLNRREAHAKNAALVFGGALHAGLETFLKGPTVYTVNPDCDAPPTSLEDTTDAHLAKCFKAILDYFGSHPAPPDEYRTSDIAIEVFTHYVQRCRLPDYHWTPMRHPETSALLVEQAFELPLGVLEVNAEIQLPSWDTPRFVAKVFLAWSGKIDLIADVNERVRVVDHKTTSIAGEQFVQDFRLSNQTIGYVWAARQLWPSLNVTGFCCNAIHLKRPSSGKGYSGPLTARGPRGGDPPLDFFRFYFDYAPARLVEWETNVLEILSDLVFNLKRGYFPMHTKNCFAKYGRCQYHDVCSLDEVAMRNTLLASDMYKPVTWDPTR
jgi:hypothetical protein